MRLPHFYLAALLFLTTLSGPAMASVPPPPPEYVFDASAVLADAANKDQAKIARFFAEDVTMRINGRRIASGKAAWLKWWTDDRSHYYGKTVGYSMGWKEDGSLLILDQFDTRDNFTSPPPPGGPRFSTRSTLCLFGADGLIHSIDISEAGSYFVIAK
jgi:hypothetical protein